MRIHYIQHVPYEGLGSIENWANDHGHELSATHVYLHETLPAHDDYDCLIIMGGPMSVNDKAQHSWISREQQFIQHVIAAKKPVLGICLGAQLIASALGAEVKANQEKEIGWFLCQRHQALTGHGLADIIPQEFLAFHWHGDTFAIPHQAIPLASSVACTNQGFIYHDRVIGLQFHFEMTAKLVKGLIKRCGHELVTAPYIQTPQTMLAHEQHFSSISRLMYKVLDYLQQQVRISR